MQYIQMISYYLRYYLNKDEKGATAIEYALIAGLVAVVIAAILVTMGQEIYNKFDSVVACLQDKNNC
jgi:pilus assembly protein Flp/PilA